ncbi:MAG: hypothetical protein KAS66_05575, partial [Candidatus Omnitrophica bacterium]|nr:hypothetical protein [Candidatus Omnitrophota bacterium]
MNDNMTATPEQKKELSIKALKIAGFTEKDNFQGMYTMEHGMKTIVVNLNESPIKSYFNVDKKKVTEDDEHDTLAKVDTMITEAEDGRMPTKREPDIIVNTGANEVTPEQTDDAQTKPESAQKEGIDFNVDPDTWPDGWDPSMGPRQTESIEHAPDTIVRSTAPPAPFVPQGTMIKTFVPGLKEIGKIKIGRKGAMKKSRAGNEYRPPEKFNHFEVVTLHKDDYGDFIPDAPVMGLIGSDCKELDVSLLYNDPTLNFFTRFNQYNGGKCMCSGDGE